ncbi:type II toxin-antitoxin system PemK/MazF family toxin [Nocardioides sp. BGMRC 2183]|nr:type II toxin-antitoxin system PemK/MazF family toxin [Nocardioides sp. BGMRC 2183]
MRPIHLVRLQKTRPAVILTRQSARDALTWVTVAPITSTIRGLATEVLVGRANGLDHESVVSCDNVQTVGVAGLGRHVGYLLDAQEPLLAAALAHAFDLRVEDLHPGR